MNISCCEKFTYRIIQLKNKINSFLKKKKKKKNEKAKFIF